MAIVFGKDRFPTEIANEVERHPEGSDVLEQKQAREAHIPHALYPVNSNKRARSTQDHGAGREEHECCDESAYDTGFRSEIPSLPTPIPPILPFLR